MTSSAIADAKELRLPRKRISMAESFEESIAARITKVQQRRGPRGGVEVDEGGVDRVICKQRRP